MVSLQAIQKAAQLLQNEVIRTPLVYSPTFSRMADAHVYLKLENLQRTGSFKLRGATYKLLSSLDKIGPQGVVAASAGNHAQGVALSARRAGVRSTIVMPEWASLTKQEATRNYGGEVILEGQNIGESIHKARELAEAGRMFIHPYDDLDIITGQGTIGIEIIEDRPDVDLVLVPVGGGGLISGIALAVKAQRPEVKVIGVQSAACPSAHEARRKGVVEHVASSRSIADGIAVKQVGDITFSIIRDRVDDIVLVEEDRIAAAILTLLERKKVLAEGAGAVPLAALFSPAVHLEKGQTVVLVISGGNVDSPLLERVIWQGLYRNGRIMKFSVCLDDVPGTLTRLLSVIAGVKANVLHIYHERSSVDLPIYFSRVQLELETRGPEHILEVFRELELAGYEIKTPGHEPFSYGVQGTA